MWDGRGILIFSICWLQCYKCSHLADFKLSIWHHRTWSWGACAQLPHLSQSKLTPTQHCRVPVPPQTGWIRTSGIGAEEYEFYQASQVIVMLTKVFEVLMNHHGGQQVPSFLAEVKYSQWEHSNEQLCWSHKWPHTKGLLIVYCDLEIHWWNLQFSR